MDDKRNAKALRAEFGEEHRFGRIMKLGENVALGVVVSLLVMVALVWCVIAFSVPNPNMILIMGLVICASLFSYQGGLTAGVIMLAYTLWFFSTGNDFVTFSDQNLQKVLVSVIGIVVVDFFVSMLRHFVNSELKGMRRLNDLLEEDNRLLEVATTHDSLTNTHNRFGLRRDFSRYLNDDLHVMMMDIDDFKQINDTHGHQVGDYILNQMGGCLIDVFGEDAVYRYGGDEFLIISKDDPDFEQHADQARERIAAIHSDEMDEPVCFSGGYTFGKPVLQSDLRFMIRLADANLYESKSAGKNRIIGCPFSRSKAEAVEPHIKVAGAGVEPHRAR